MSSNNATGAPSTALASKRAKTSYDAPEKSIADLPSYKDRKEQLKLQVIAKNSNSRNFEKEVSMSDAYVLHDEDRSYLCVDIGSFRKPFEFYDHNETILEIRLGGVVIYKSKMAKDERGVPIFLESHLIKFVWYDQVDCWLKRDCNVYPIEDSKEPPPRSKFLDLVAVLFKMKGVEINFHTLLGPEPFKKEDFLLGRFFAWTIQDTVNIDTPGWIKVFGKTIIKCGKARDAFHCDYDGSIVEELGDYYPVTSTNKSRAPAAPFKRARQKSIADLAPLDLAPFVVAVLKDFSIQELVEENKKLHDKCEKKLLLQVIVRRGDSKTFHTVVSMREAYIVNDQNSHHLLCVDIPQFRRPFEFYDRDDTLEINLGGVVVYKSNMVQGAIGPFAFFGNHLLDFVWHDQAIWLNRNGDNYSAWSKYMDLVAVLFEVDEIPGVMETLFGSKQVESVQELHSCWWVIRDTVDGWSEGWIKVVGRNGLRYKCDQFGNTLEYLF